MAVKDIEQIASNLLPSRQFGFFVMSTNVGIMDHLEARHRHLGGKVLGYFF